VVATIVNNLGLGLKDLGELQEARKCFERALKIDEAVYGPDHPVVATRVNNLGGVLKDLGEPITKNLANNLDNINLN
jgi:tetratricopeptide (TPR) repeat protein